MPQDKLSLVEQLKSSGMLSYIWILIICGWAGTVRYLTTLEGKAPTWLGWVTEIIVSGFVGVLTATVCQYYGIDFLLMSAITGIMAHNGTRSLYILSEVIKKNSSIYLDSKQNGAGQGVRLDSKRDK